MPIFNGLFRDFIRLQNWVQLCQWHCQAVFNPSDIDKYLSPKFFFRRQADDLNFIGDSQWGHSPLRRASSGKRKSERIFQVAVPAHGSLFFSLGIDYDLRLDALFPLVVEFWSLCHAISSGCSNLRKFPAVCKSSSCRRDEITLNYTVKIPPSN